MIIEILLGISVISNLVLLYGVRNLLKQNEQLEDTLSEVVLNTTQTLTDTLEEMKRIDLRGSFESDDEVGSVFQQLKSIIEKLNQNYLG
jgi:competence protein ComGC|tara:strand:+ start:2035 stop:2301 length:267 start_codon:yes stop_codon:yes gene_type:complete